MSETHPTRRIPFWLTLSVMANLLLVGLLVGMALRAPMHGRGPDGGDGPRPPMLDAEAVRKAFASLRIADETVHATIQESLVHRMGDLTLAQRKSLAEMLSREPGDDRGRRRMRMRDDDNGPHGPPPDED